MTKQYYYTCSESVIYMTKYFGISAKAPRGGKMYVTRGTEGVFEPKDGDLGVDEDEAPCNRDVGKWLLNDAEYGFGVEGKVRIIMRDNKNFISLEVEDD